MSDILYSPIKSTATSYTDRLVDMIENRVPNIPLNRKEKDVLTGAIKSGYIYKVEMEIEADGRVLCEIFRETDSYSHELYVSWQHNTAGFIHAYTFWKNGKMNENRHNLSASPTVTFSQP